VEIQERLHQGPQASLQPPVEDQTPWPSRWTLRTIRAAFDWLHAQSLSGVWRTLKRARIGLRWARVQHYSPDPAYADKLTYLLACLREVALDPKKTVLLFLDEMGYTRWPDPAQDWAASAPAPVPVAERAGENNRQERLIGALNACTGAVTYLSNYIVGRKQVIACYKQIEASYPHAQRIYVVQDNWSVHHHPDVLEALTTMPRVEPVWLPTYAPWLNPIEKLWRWLRQDVLKMHRWAGEFGQLRQRVRAFLEQFALGSQALLHYVGLLGEGQLAQALRSP